MAYAMGETPLESLRNLLNAGASRAGEATAAAQDGVGQVLAGGQQIQQQITNANNQAAAATAAANGMGYDINSLRALVDTLLGQADKINGTADSVFGQASLVNKTADEVKGQASTVNDTALRLLAEAGGLDPFIGELGSMGTELWRSGAEQVTEARKTMGIGSGILNLNASSSPLAREFVNALNALSGDAQVSMAAADTQSSFDSAYQQMIRNIARSGGATGSGSSVAKLQKQYMQALATAKAAAKTRARTAGIKDRLPALGLITDKANSILGTGNTMYQAGVTAQNAGATATKGAGDLQTAKAGLVADAGKLQASAGELFGTAGNLQTSAGNLMKGAGDLQTSAANTMSAAGDAQYRAGALGASKASALTDAGQLYVQTGNLQNSYLQTVNSAYNNLSDAMIAAANYYRDAAATEVSAVNGGGGGGGGGVRITNSDSGDNWMNWRGTGHSQSWNQNNGFKLAREMGVM